MYIISVWKLLFKQITKSLYYNYEICNNIAIIVVYHCLKLLKNITNTIKRLQNCNF